MPGIETNDFEPEIAEFMHQPWLIAPVSIPMRASSPACRRTKTVTLPNRARSNSAGTSGSRRGDDFVPCLHRRGPKRSVRSCRCKMTLDVEGVVDCCMH